MAKRYGVSDETVRKWRKRGEQAVQNRSSRPNGLAWRMNEEERAIICAVRRATDFVLDEMLAVLAREADLEWLMIDSTIVRSSMSSAISE